MWGRWFDELFSPHDQLPLLNGQLRGDAEADGYRYSLFLNGDAYLGGGLVVRAIRPDEAYHSSLVPSFSDEQGRFQLYVEVSTATVVFFIPFGAVPSNPGNVIQLEITAISSQEPVAVLGQGVFDCPWQNRRYQPVAYWRPLIGLCMHLARADDALAREAVRLIRERLIALLSLEREDLPVFKDVMKSEPSSEVGALIKAHRFRAPSFDNNKLFAVLADIAHANGSISGREVALLQEIATGFGASAEQWEGLKTYYKLTSRIELIQEHLDVLELGEDYSRKDVEKAYRSKIKMYHPDRYSSLPPEFQEIAHQKTQQLNNARDALLNHLSA